MNESDLQLECVRQVAMDGLMVLGMLILLAVELPL